MQQHENTVSKRNERIQKKLAEVPPLKRKLYQRALDGTATKKDAIKAFCNECMMDVTQEVRLCTAVTCPLWKYRPYQKQSNNPQRQKGDQPAAPLC